MDLLDTIVNRQKLICEHVTSKTLAQDGRRSTNRGVALIWLTSESWLLVPPNAVDICTPLLQPARPICSCPNDTHPERRESLARRCCPSDQRVDVDGITGAPLASSLRSKLQPVAAACLRSSKLSLAPKISRRYRLCAS